MEKKDGTVANIIARKSWHLPEHRATPEDIYLSRRSVLRAAAATGLAAALPAVAKPALAQDGEIDPSASLYPVARNEAYQLDRELTPEEYNLKYNNFYEFGSHKQIHKAAQALRIRPWEIAIDGLVEEPMVMAIDDLLARVSLEERLYRLRCVEAWSMTVPWSGFPLASLVALAKPLASARYLRFETFNDPSMASGQRQNWYPWPYVEAVTIDEAANELAFMVTGAYGKPVAKQMGAPLRLALPWKYGFKSIKSITRISFTEERPISFWEEVGPAEYGFWANVNPDVPHPRWSQARERILHTGETVPTLLYNGYGEQVAGLYAGLEGERLFM